MRHLIAGSSLCLCMLASSGRAERPENRPLGSPRDMNPKAQPEADAVAQHPADRAENPGQLPGSQGGLPSPKLQVQMKDVTLEAIKLARSSDKASHEQLRTLLTNKDYLLSLNTPDHYLRLPPECLQLHFILDALTERPDELPLGTLDCLADSPLYQQPGPRQILLLTASGKINSAPPKLTKLWERQLAPEADELDLTVEALIANGSPAAIGILEKALLNNEYEPDYVIAWLQEPVLTHRQDLPLLVACERLLQAEKWPTELKSALVEVLYDYRPKHWYLMDNAPPEPPRRDALSPAARTKLIEIAELALREGYLDETRRAKIQAELTAK